MSVLELLFYVASILLLGVSFSAKPMRPTIIFYVFVGMIVVVLTQVAFGVVRWQYFAMYIGIFVMGFLLVLRMRKQVILSGYIRTSVLVVSLLLLLTSLASSLVFPMYELPEPTGDYLIGTETFVVTDYTRDEQYNNQTNQARRIKVQLWYPAETVDGYVQVPWLQDGIDVARGLSIDTGLPAFVLDHTVDIMSHSYLDAPLSDDLDQYPVVIISHGWRGFRNLHTDYAEELASHGYIVAAIDHTYGSVATVFEDGTEFVNYEALPGRETTPDFLDYANELVLTYAGDIRATLSRLTALNNATSSSRFSERMDLDNIGLIGHSTGGGAAVAFAFEDDRIDAVIGLDAWVEPIGETTLASGYDTPSLFLRSGAWEISYNNDYLYTLLTNSTATEPLYQIDGTTHYDFAMVYMYSPLTPYIGFTGSVESDTLITILRSTILSYFDEQLSRTTVFLDPTQWEDVRIIDID